MDRKIFIYDNTAHARTHTGTHTQTSMRSRIAQQSGLCSDHNKTFWREIEIRARAVAYLSVLESALGSCEIVIA